MLITPPTPENKTTMMSMMHRRFAGDLLRLAFDHIDNANRREMFQG